MKNRTRWRQAGLAVAALSILAIVFCLYGQPDMVFDLATNIWSCI